jgi:hypothetical protein
MPKTSYAVACIGTVGQSQLKSSLHTEAVRAVPQAAEPPTPKAFDIAAQGNTLGKRTTFVPTLKGLNIVPAMDRIVRPLQGDEPLIVLFPQGITLGWTIERLRR